MQAGAWPPAEALKLLGVGALVAAHWITFFLAARLSSVSVCLAGLATLALWTSLLEPLLLWRRVRPYEVGLGLLAMLGLYLISQAEFNSTDRACWWRWYRQGCRRCSACLNSQLVEAARAVAAHVL
ncbi:MAG: hypothetical protein WKG07_07745 [Hymenobacter sp.]